MPFAEVIGDPIAQSKSPKIHKFWLEKLRIEADYRATQVRPDELHGYFSQRRGDSKWLGCNVTIPYKETVLALADRSTATASKVGAANCMVRTATGLIASNTDIDGIKESIDHGWWGDACLLGNGGAARAALAHLANPDENKNAPRQRTVNIVARDTAKSQSLLSEFNLEGKAYSFDAVADGLRHAQLVVNATSLGMAGQQPLPRKVLDALQHAYADAMVFDMVYAPLQTELLREARRLEMTPVDGLTMLIGQAARAFELFFGTQAPREHDSELRALLVS